MYYPLTNSSCKDSLKVLEEDIQRANTLAATIPRAKHGSYLQMKLVHTDGRTNLSAYGRKATIRDFYAVILPSLQRLQANSEEIYDVKEGDIRSEMSSEKSFQGDGKLSLSKVDLEREDECGICLEPSTKMVFPNCCHSMCIKCYHNWNKRSESCPFCRGSLKRIKSEDLWVLTCSDDVVDAEMASKEDLSRFYLYISNLPKQYPDALFLVYYEYLI